MESGNSSTNSCLFEICWTHVPVTQTLYVISLLVSLVLCLPLNVWILLSAIKQAASNQGLASSEILAINQAAMELCNCLCFCLLLLTNVVCHETLNDIALNMRVSGFCGRTLFCASICVERYIAVVHPMTYLSQKMSKFRILSAVVVWIVSAGCGVLGGKNSRFFVLFQLIFCASIAIMIFCSVAILKVLIKPKPGDRSSKTMDLNTKKAFRVITLILLFTLSCYIPTVVIAMILNNFMCEGTTLASGLFIPNFVLLPLLYLSKVGKIRCLTCL